MIDLFFYKERRDVRDWFMCGRIREEDKIDIKLIRINEIVF